MNTTTLTPTQQVIFDTFRRRFDDLPSFDSLAAEPIRKSIVDLETGKVVLNSTTVKSFTKEYISTRELPSKAEKDLAVEVNHIICTLCVYMIRRSRPPGTDIYSLARIEELNEILLGCEAFDDIECNLLLTFGDVVQTAVMLFPSRLNKARILFIGHRLGGTDLRKGKHTTGGGQCDATDRRVRLYEVISGFCLEKRSEVVPPTVPPVLPTTPIQPASPAAPSVVAPAPSDALLIESVASPAAKAERSHPVPPRRANKRPHQAIEVNPPVPDEPQEVHEAYQKALQAAAEYKAIAARSVKQKSSAQPAPQPEDSAKVHKLMLPPAKASARQSSSAPSSAGFSPAPVSSTSSASAHQARNYPANILRAPTPFSAEGWRRKTWGKGLAKHAELLQQAVSSISPDGDHHGPAHEGRYDDDPNFDMGDKEAHAEDLLQVDSMDCELPLDGVSISAASWSPRSHAACTAGLKYSEADRALDCDAASTLISISGN